MKLLASLSLALGLAAAAAANPLVGSWTAATGQKMTVAADGSMTWNGIPLRYQVQGNVLVYQSQQGMGMAQFQVQGDQLTLAGQEIGMVQMTRAAAGMGGMPGVPGMGGAPANPGSPGMTGVPAVPAPPQVPAPAAPSPPMGATMGAPPSAGDYVAQSYGFRMTPAPGWQPRETDSAVVFGHQTTPGMLMISISDEAITPAEIQKVAYQGYSEPGFEVKPVTPGQYAQVPTGVGTGYYFRVTGTMQGQQIAGFAGAYLPPGGQAITALAVTTPEKVKELEPAARAMLSSVRLSQATNPAIQTWDQELRGMKVQYMWSYSSGLGTSGPTVSGSNNKDWHLCRDGRYWYRGSSHISADSGGYDSGGTFVGGNVSALGNGNANEVGTWEIVANGGQGAAIVFRPQGAGAYRYVLSKQRKRGTSFMQKHFGDLGVYAAEYAQCN